MVQNGLQVLEVLRGQIIKIISRASSNVTVLPVRPQGGRQPGHRGLALPGCGLWVQLPQRAGAAGFGFVSGRAKSLWLARTPCTGSREHLCHLLPSLSHGVSCCLTQSSTQEIGEELEDGVIYSISLRKVQLHHTANKGQRWLGVSWGSASIALWGVL